MIIPAEVTTRDAIYVRDRVFFVMIIPAEVTTRDAIYVQA